MPTHWSVTIDYIYQEYRAINYPQMINWNIYADGWKQFRGSKCSGLITSEQIL